MYDCSNIGMFYKSHWYNIQGWPLTLTVNPIKKLFCNGLYCMSIDEICIAIQIEDRNSNQGQLLSYLLHLNGNELILYIR